jgi:hypothetical protein
MARRHWRFAYFLLVIFVDMEDFIFEIGGNKGGEELLFRLEVDWNLFLLWEGLSLHGDAFDRVDLNFMRLECLCIKNAESITA